MRQSQHLPLLSWTEFASCVHNSVVKTIAPFHHLCKCFCFLDNGPACVSVFKQTFASVVVRFFFLRRQAIVMVRYFYYSTTVSPSLPFGQIENAVCMCAVQTGFTVCARVFYVSSVSADVERNTWDQNLCRMHIARGVKVLGGQLHNEIERNWNDILTPPLVPLLVLLLPPSQPPSPSSLLETKLISMRRRQTEKIHIIWENVKHILRVVPFCTNDNNWASSNSRRNRVCAVQPPPK